MSLRLRFFDGAEGERNAEKIANVEAQHSAKGDAGDLGDRGPVGGGVETRAEEDQRGGGIEEKNWASFHPMLSVLRAEPRRNSSAVCANLSARSKKIGPWEPPGTIQSDEFGIARYISDDNSTG